MSSYAVVFFVWGKTYIDNLVRCLESSEHLKAYDWILITDKATRAADYEGTFKQIIQPDFEMEGLIRKTELIKFLPRNYEAFLLLDCDTLVLKSIDLGFEKAKKHGIAMVPEPRYSLDYYFDFANVLERENIPQQGLLGYNTGVIFFSITPEVEAVFQRWLELALKYQDIFTNDQPFFTLAMEQLGFNPYTLSISYNYRAYNQGICGYVHIWHAYNQPPEKLNDYPAEWPPRKVFRSELTYVNKITPKKLKNRFFYALKLLGQGRVSDVLKGIKKLKP